MKFVSFAIGFTTGVFAISALILASEVFRAYRQNIESDPWQEYSSDEDLVRAKPTATNEELVEKFKVANAPVMTDEEFKKALAEDNEFIEYWARMDHKSRND